MPCASKTMVTALYARDMLPTCLETHALLLISVNPPDSSTVRYFQTVNFFSISRTDREVVQAYV